MAQKVRKALKGQKIGLIFVDADPFLHRVFARYGACLADDCLLVIDDYISDAAIEKSTLIKPFIDKLVNNGALREFIVTQYGTWIGQINGDHGLRILKLTQPSLFIYDAGACYVYEMWSKIRPDLVNSPVQSKLHLFEEGKLLGPVHSPHVEIREKGKGRYSHWGQSTEPDEYGLWRSSLYFSASEL